MSGQEWVPEPADLRGEEGPLSPAVGPEPGFAYPDHVPPVSYTPDDPEPDDAEPDDAAPEVRPRRVGFRFSLPRFRARRDDAAEAEAEEGVVEVIAGPDAFDADAESEAEDGGEPAPRRRLAFPFRVPSFRRARAASDEGPMPDDAAEIDAEPEAEAEDAAPSRRFPALPLTREARVGIAAALSFVILVTVWINNRGKAPAPPLAAMNSPSADDGSKTAKKEVEVADAGKEAGPKPTKKDGPGDRFDEGVAQFRSDARPETDAAIAQAPDAGGMALPPAAPTPSDPATATSPPAPAEVPPAAPVLAANEATQPPTSPSPAPGKPEAAPAPTPADPDVVLPPTTLADATPTPATSATHEATLADPPIPAASPEVSAPAESMPPMPEVGTTPPTMPEVGTATPPTMPEVGTATPPAMPEVGTATPPMPEAGTPMPDIGAPMPPMPEAGTIAPTTLAETPTELPGLPASTLPAGPPPEPAAKPAEPEPIAKPAEPEPAVAPAEPQPSAPVPAQRTPPLESIPETADPTPATPAAPLGDGWVVIKGGARRVVVSSPLQEGPDAAIAAGAAGALAGRIADGPPPREDIAARDQIEPRLHRVRSQENFWTISRDFYGTGRYYRALWKANAREVPDIRELYVGTVIRVPPPETLDRSLVDPAPPARVVDKADRSDVSRTSNSEEADVAPVVAAPSFPPVRRRGREVEAPDEPPARPTYKVRPYETLRSIARDTLGDSRRDREILQLNRSILKDASDLAPGQVLTLPADAQSGRRGR